MSLGGKTPPRTSEPAVTHDPFAPFEPLAEDVYPQMKRVAGRFVQMLATYEPGVAVADLVGDAAQRKTSGFSVAEAAREARLLVIEGARSRAQIVYPQLGGLDPHGSPKRAAVMVVVRQQVQQDNGDARSITRTVDVRLRRQDGQWRIDALVSAGGEPALRPENLGKAATAVLDNPRIELPDSARWDIHRGDIDRQVLKVMNKMATLFPFKVAVLRSGHPIEVFGAQSISNHTRGRAVDVWAIDGTPVVRQNAGITYDTSAIRAKDKRQPAFRMTSNLLNKQDVPELGSPWNLDPAGQPSFTDPVHQDHLHIGFSSKG